MYYKVPPIIFNQLTKADSAGVYYNQNIKKSLLVKK
ncbi:KTSC domain-containing protein [Halanaerocella petrolearia]